MEGILSGFIQPAAMLEEWVSRIAMLLLHNPFLMPGCAVFIVCTPRDPYPYANFQSVGERLLAKCKPNAES
jgi:hypothetical protein